ETGHGLRRIDAVDDDRDLRAAPREIDHAIELCRSDSDRVEDVLETVVEEILRLAQRRDRDRPGVRAERQPRDLEILRGLHVRAQDDALRLEALAHRAAIALDL